MHKDISIGDMPAYHSYPNDTGKHPSLIVIHEIWGLNEHIKNIADRFAAEGYSVVAPNLFFDIHFAEKVDQTILADMQNPEKRDTAQQKMREIFAPVRSPEFAETSVKRLVDCVNFLLDHEFSNGKVGITGFCFGGTFSYALATAETRLNTCVPFYGHPPTLDKVKNINCPVLAFYGENDAPLMQTLPELEKAFKDAGKEFTAVVYPHTGHAFFNDTNPRMYNKEAATDAWKKTLEFLKINL